MPPIVMRILPPRYRRHRRWRGRGEKRAAAGDLMPEERLQYVGSMVLGLNDALVELTGTLAGLTLALQNTKLIALSGLITGVSAALSRWLRLNFFRPAAKDARMLLSPAFIPRQRCMHYRGAAPPPILFLMTSIICTLWARCW